MSKPTVNKKVFSIPKSILYTGKLLQIISPKLAMRFAFKLFMTPYKFKRPRREDKMYEEATKKMMLVPSLQKKIQIYKYGTSKKKILLIHGWAGRGTQLFKIADFFIEKGYAIVSFDATAHGDSEGKTSAMTEFIPSILEIEKQHGPFEFAVGHSLGSMALLNAVKQGFDLKKIAIIGTADSITKICHQFVERLGLKLKVAVLLKARLDSELGFDAEELSANIAAKEVTIPTLVIHDNNDTDVPVNCAKTVHKSLENSELMITDGLGHRRVLCNTEVIEKMNSFFEN